MDKRLRLDPVAFENVSPEIVDVLERMLREHGWLASVPTVHVTILAIAARFQARLRATKLVPVLTEADRRRALIFVQNIAKGQPGFPSLSIATLFDAAMNTIARSRRTTRRDAAAAFELAVATIVHLARSPR